MSTSIESQRNLWGQYESAQAKADTPTLSTPQELINEKIKNLISNTKWLDSVSSIQVVETADSITVKVW